MEIEESYESDGDEVHRKSDEERDKRKLSDLNLTKSVRPIAKRSSIVKHGVRLAKDKADLVASDSLQTSADKGNRIHFDPRVVITEYDDHMERHWYTEEELNVLKNETIMIAHQYFICHPEQAEIFNAKRIDPITGLTRKKALFSLPILNSLPEEFDLMKESERLDILLKATVKKILIIDPNKAILELFCKAIQRIFPHAAISAVETGEDALRLYTAELSRHRNGDSGQQRSFDIIIVEQRLIRPHRRANSVEASSSVHSASALQGLTKPEPLEKHTSFSHFDNLAHTINSSRRPFMSGSQLIERICQIEDQAYAPATVQSDPPPIVLEGKRAISTSFSTSSIRQYRALKIGVTVNTERDSETLRQSGADIIWPKPPPPIGIVVRNQLLSSLLAKRGMSSLCATLPSDISLVKT
jgi:hypothetical protein